MQKPNGFVECSIYQVSKHLVVLPVPEVLDCEVCDTADGFVCGSVLCKRTVVAKS